MLSACSGDDGGTSEEGLLPADYASTYTEVRDCRFSLDHDLNYQRVLASPDAVTPYTDRMAPFPTGSTVVKVQYGEDDDACAGPIVTYTLMQKLDVGSAPPSLDWEWQKLDADRKIDTSYEIERCISCHTTCGVPPEGYAGTCEVP